LDLAKAVICGEGSEPMDKIQTSGVCGSDSSQVFSKSKMHASPYSGPRESVRHDGLYKYTVIIIFFIPKAVNLNFTT